MHTEQGDDGLPCYAITTVQGAIPHIIDIEQAFLQHPRKVYIDDFLYLNSFYHKGGEAMLQKFIGSPTAVYLAFKEGPCVLKSKHGNYKLAPDTYNEMVTRMAVGAHADYTTGKLWHRGAELVEPASVAEFNEMLASGARLFGTGFINKMTQDAMVLCIADSRLAAKSIEETDNEYVKYMLSINEMNAFTFISESNYRVFHEYFEALPRGAGQAEQE